MFKSNGFLTSIDPQKIPESQLKTICGAVMLVTGSLIYIDQSLKLGWLSMGSIVIMGLFFIYIGVFLKKVGFILPGGMALGVGIGLYFLFSYENRPIFEKIGFTSGSIALGWFIVFFASYIGVRKYLWWSFLCGTVFLAISYTLNQSQTDFLTWIFSMSLGCGIGLLAWGIKSRYLGLIIPGCLVITIGPGLFFAWGSAAVNNPLSQTGLMLVWFSMGWFLITVLSRLIIPKFLWWPLIPGGIIAVVGWGLSIGGNPSNALIFISNSGSIGLIIFGLYLLFMKMGIRK